MKITFYINYILQKGVVESVFSGWDFFGCRFNGAEPPRSDYDEV